MQPHVKPLSYWQRKLVFVSLLLAFLVSLPAIIFYSTGYRYNFSADKPTFTVTGAFYVTADAPGSTIYLNDTLAQNIRSFRSAFYLQGVIPGVHQLHVQVPGGHTWVKELPVEAQTVTEAEAFNLPITPQVRLITTYVTAAGNAVIFPHSSTTPGLQFVASSTPLTFATTTATSSYRMNQEYVLLRDFFAEQASSTALREAVLQQEREQFGFASGTSLVTDTTEVGTTTVSRDTLTLIQRGEDVYARADQSGFRQIPHYFCAPYITEQDVFATMPTSEPVLPSTREPELLAQVTPACRDEIRISRQGQTVLGFDFFPATSNLVLMHLTEGAYVVEVDDRAWQNIQPLYLGRDIEVLLYRGSIFIKEGELIFEVLTQIVEV
jgi:hypothetical protein